MIQYIELRLYGSLTDDDYEILSAVKNLTFDKRRNDIGVINFDYPLDLAKAVGLNEESARVGVVLGFSDGTVKEVEQYLLQTESDQKVVDDVRMLTVSGEDTKTVLKDAIVYPSNWPVAQPTGHEFIDNNIGTIMRTLVLRAHNRGTISQVDETSFSGTLDSSGNAWDNVFSVNYSTGVNYWQILTDRANIGLADVEMINWELKVYNGGTLGNHVDIDTLEVRPAHNVTEMVTNTDRSESYSTVLIEGDEGTALERHSSPAVGNIGRRRETYLGQSGITADGVLAIIGDAYLEQVSTIPTEETVGITTSTGADPFLDFDVNDWIWVRFEGSEAAVERRIYQIAVGVDDSGNISVGLTLNSIIAENLIRLQRKIDAYASGGLLGSVPDAGPGVDEIKPNPVTSININSAAYEAQGATQAAISVTWTDPTTNEDGTAFTDFDHYDIQWRYSDDPAFSGSAGNTYTAYAKPWGYNPVVPGKTIFVRVRVVDSSGNKSSWTTSGGHVISNDDIAPSQPSMPTTAARGGAVSVSWDGLANGGGAMPADFKDLQVHRSTVSGFTPTWGGSTKAATWTGPNTSVFTDMPLQTTWYFKFLARDRAGNVSTPSPQSAAQSVTPIVDTDLIGQIIKNANIEDGTIVASDKVFSNSVVTANLAALVVKAGYIDTNAVNASNIQTGALSAYLVNGNVIVASATGSDTGTRVRITSAGIEGYNGSTKYFDLTSGGVTITGGLIQTASGTTRVYMNSSGLFAQSGGSTTFSLTASGGSGTFDGTVTSGNLRAGDVGSGDYFNVVGGNSARWYLTNSLKGTINATNSTFDFISTGILRLSSGSSIRMLNLAEATAGLTVDFGATINSGGLTINAGNLAMATTGALNMAGSNLNGVGSMAFNSWGAVTRGAEASGGGSTGVGNGFRVLRVPN